MHSSSTAVQEAAADQLGHLARAESSPGLMTHTWSSSESHGPKPRRLHRAPSDPGRACRRGAPMLRTMATSSRSAWRRRPLRPARCTSSCSRTCSRAAPTPGSRWSAWRRSFRRWPRRMLPPLCCCRRLGPVLAELLFCPVGVSAVLLELPQATNRTTATQGTRELRRRMTTRVGPYTTAIFGTKRAESSAGLPGARRSA